MSKLVLVLLVLYLSLHACRARHLSLSHKTIDRKSDIIDKDVRSRKLGSSLLLTHSEPKLVQTQEETSSSSAADELENTVMGKDLGTVILEKDEKKGGVISYSVETTQRSTLESSPNEVRGTANSEDNDIEDDVVAMDYAKPHRKPPIHNRKL